METIKISELPLGTLEGSEELPFVDSDGVTKRGNVSSKANDADVVHKTGNETIAGTKTFEDTTNINGELQLNDSGGERVSVLKFHAKNQADNGGVDWKFYADADNVVIGTRKFGLWGYPLKPSDGSYGGYESFITASFPTYDGNTTYTKQIDVNAPIYFANDVYTTALAFRYNSIEDRLTNSDTGEVVFNYWGYNGGTTRFRDTTFFNGKQGEIFKIIGSTGKIRYIGDGTYGAGKVLTSDASGNATWQGAISVRLNPRVAQADNYTTSVTMDFDAYDEYDITAQAGALLFNNPSGTPTNCQKRIIRIKDNGTARALTYGTQFASGAATLPTTTTISKKLWIGVEWDSTDSKWYCIATGVQP